MAIVFASESHYARTSEPPDSVFRCSSPVVSDGNFRSTRFAHDRTRILFGLVPFRLDLSPHHAGWRELAPIGVGKEFPLTRSSAQRLLRFHSGQSKRRRPPLLHPRRRSP